MAQTNLNIRMDSELKNEFSALCENIGMSMTTAFCIFARKAVSEQRIPFELTANDPFYSESNMSRLRQAVKDVSDGRSVLKEHDLTDIDGED